MRFSLFAMVRLMVILVTTFGLVAVGLARMEPKVSHFRLGVPPHYSVINGFAISHPHKDTEFLDCETGEFASVLIPTEDRIEFASCSPWQDDEGQSQVVGRWVHKVGEGATVHCEGLGLARYSLPSGRVLNHVTLDVMPTGHPCWFPGLSAKVLFAVADGRLYTMSFPDRPDSENEATLMAISWRCPQPGPKIFIKDPVWPNNPRFGGRLIVSLAYQTGEIHAPLRPARLWWLKLSDDGKAIVDAGEIATPVGEVVGGKRIEERFPNVAVTPEGDFALTYLWQHQGERHWNLRFSLVSASESNAPTVLPGTSRSLTEFHLPAVAPFSADGRWVFSLVENEPDKLEMVRISTARQAIVGE